MHGTVMMFLFAVPAVEALAVYLLPNMLGARDLPFPRLSAYAFWATRSAAWPSSARSSSASRRRRLVHVPAADRQASIRRA
jgi:heme/copper-type cytochrome/quinol oxidase subunit 1